MWLSVLTSWCVNPSNVFRRCREPGSDEYDQLAAFDGPHGRDLGCGGLAIDPSRWCANRPAPTPVTRRADASVRARNAVETGRGLWIGLDRMMWTAYGDELVSSAALWHVVLHIGCASAPAIDSKETHRMTSSFTGAVPAVPSAPAQTSTMPIPGAVGDGWPVRPHVTRVGSFR